MFFYFSNFPLIIIIFSILSNSQAQKDFILQNGRNFSLIRDLTCLVAKDELEKHPEMRTIALVEVTHDFPPEFTSEILKCLPDQVSKIILKPHSHVSWNTSIILSKESMIIYVVDDFNHVSSMLVCSCEFQFFKSKLIFYRSRKLFFQVKLHFTLCTRRFPCSVDYQKFWF